MRNLDESEINEVAGGNVVDDIVHAVVSKIAEKVVESVLKEMAPCDESPEV